MKHEQNKLRLRKNLYRNLFKISEFQASPDFSNEVMNKILQTQERLESKKLRPADFFGLPMWEVATAFAVFALVAITSFLPNPAVRETPVSFELILLSSNNGGMKPEWFFSDQDLDREDLLETVLGSEDSLGG